ncbi:MAG: hypothetical protein IT368_15460 [Candidatus Hydrogenedentes bacterium]|nr:hypothetical protein [Candidatus Hydrogenedentota bacterium]
MKLDSQLRIILPEGNPGDEYEIQKQGEGRFLLIPLKNKPRTPEEILKAMDENPLSPTMSWEELRQMTREP